MQAWRYYLLRTLARIPLLLVMFTLDIVVFNSYLFPFEGAPFNQVISRIFWTFHIFAYLAFLTVPATSFTAIKNPLTRDFNALLTGLYISKFVGLLLFALGAILLGAMEGINSFSEFGWDIRGSWYLLRAASLISAFILFGLLFYGMIRNRYRFQLRKVSVPIANLPKELDGFVIVQFSDAHLGSISKPEAIRPGIAMINAQNPDLVCFTGDLVNNQAREAIPFVPELSKIESKYGVVSILGNHDYGDYTGWSSLEEKTNNMESLVEVHKDLNWILLQDEVHTLTVDDQEISIIGVQNISGKGRFKNYGDLKKAYSASTAGLKILLTHDPSHWRSEVLDYKDIRLSLSGHTHGMQFGFEFSKSLRWSPVKWVYKEWAGLYQEGEQYLYVNRGFGYLGYPGRVGILPEITRIELKAVSNQ
ncbi:MAG: metallophosphoesterase [Saprospiraceae bacterium]|nr:metallophosphoesterase [Saprospiraceae bacterium]